MHWLDELSMQYRSRGKLQEAVSCVTKSMHYFGQDKGEAQAQVGLGVRGMCRELLEGVRSFSRCKCKHAQPPLIVQVTDRGLVRSTLRAHFQRPPSCQTAWCPC